MAKIIQLKDASGNVYPQTANQSWRVVGQIMSSTSVLKGYGNADVWLMPNGVYRVDFACKLTAIDSATNIYSWGVDFNLINATVGKSLTPMNIRGHWTAYNSSGALLYSDVGYASNWTSREERWLQPSRKYAESGSENGGWASNHFAVGTYFEGTVYAI